MTKQTCEMIQYLITNRAWEKMYPQYDVIDWIIYSPEDSKAYRK